MWMIERRNGIPDFHLWENCAKWKDLIYESRV